MPPFSCIDWIFFPAEDETVMDAFFWSLLHRAGVWYGDDSVFTRGFFHFVDGEVDIVIAEEPVRPEPVQVRSGDIVEGVEEIPGGGVFAVPAVHIGVQTFFKELVAQHVFYCQV